MTAQSAGRTDDCPFREELTSVRTEALFAGLTLLFLGLFAWRLVVSGSSVLAGVFLFFSCMFLFYTVNFRRLLLCLNRTSLTLRFGLFSWVAPVDRIDDCRIDEIPAFLKYGGAGIHFMTVRGRYRVSFNFLEYPRVVLALKGPVVVVKDVSFSTCRPEELLRLIREAAGLNRLKTWSGVKGMPPLS